MSSWNGSAVLVLCGILGLLVGSFLNVVALRLPRRQSIIYPPSHCMSCYHRLHLLDLIPVVSYLLLRGRCRYCGIRISPVYIRGELIACAGFMFLGGYWGITPELPVSLLFGSVLLVAALADLQYLMIPDKLMGFALVTGVMLRLWVHPLPLWNYGLAFIAGGASLYFIAWIGWRIYQKEAMGGGDIKLLAVIGLFTGLHSVIITLLVSSLTAILLTVLRSWTGKYKRGDTIAFGPYLAVGGFVGYLWAAPIVDSYTSWLLAWL